MAGADTDAVRAALAELAAGARGFGLPLSIAQIACFEIYIDTLLVWNRRLSLTAARTAGEVVRKHILDSLPAARLIPSQSTITEPRVADLGSGAGFPGVPMAIVRPDAHVTLVEPRRKRANFLREIAREVPLPNVEVREEHAETISGDAAVYDLVVSRALWPLPKFLDISRRLLRPGGLAIAMKGPKTAAEETAPGFAAQETVRYALPDGAQHVLLVYRRRTDNTDFNTTFIPKG